MISSLTPLVELLRKKKELDDDNSDNFIMQIMMWMDGICIFLDYDIDGMCLKETKAFVSEIYINGKPYVGALYGKDDTGRNQ